MDLTIIAQEFRWEKNCGSLARAMANFGFGKLVFLNPKCDFKGKEAIMHAKHAKSILLKAETIGSFREALSSFNTVIGTTAMVGNDYNIPRCPVSPEELASMLPGGSAGKAAIIIGREGEGMSNDEIAKCDFVVTIPASKKYPTMNVSHAAAIIMYELSKHSAIQKAGKGINQATRKEKDVIMRLLDDAMGKMQFSTEEKKETQRQVWRRMVGKGMLTRREAFALCGFLKK
ncbi:MAG TPA: TrmJ/YjtD family RNA methyltransferase, partial [Nanoarchaeota archaeon]|nr:TrmJ/YjtD family RNA methyltransferase [Nanoarchaeota archaeon]